MAQPKLSPRDIWRTLILACRRTLSPLAVWKIPMPKITLFFTGIPVVVTAILIGVLDFWIVLVLQFSDNTYRLSLWKRVPVNSRHSDGPMKIFLTCGALRSSLFKMADGKKQKSTKPHQNLCCSACWKEMSRHYGLGNRCTSTSCHSATMTILAMHLISRWNWNGKCYGKSWCARRIPVPKSREVLQFVNTIY